jgi:hypothetical protein
VKPAKEMYVYLISYYDSSLTDIRYNSVDEMVHTAAKRLNESSSYIVAKSKL